MNIVNASMINAGLIYIYILIFVIGMYVHPIADN